MTLNGKILAIALVAMFVAGAVGLPKAAGRAQEGPVYSLEGAWYGMTTFEGGAIPPTPTFDTFTSNAQRHGVEGTFLCTIPAELAVGQTPSGHGNWVRVGTNRYAFTAMRAIMNGGTFVGWARFWGTITPVSDEELTGTINAQFYLPNGDAISPQFAGTLERHRIGITYEQ